MNELTRRLKRLETIHTERTACLYPDDSDGFCAAVVGDRAGDYAHGAGFDAVAAISSTAMDDWREYAW